MAQLDDLAKKASTGSPDDLLKFRQHFALMGEFQKTLIGVKTETARALSSMRIKTEKTGGFKNVDIDELNKSNPKQWYIYLVTVVLIFCFIWTIY